MSGLAPPGPATPRSHEVSAHVRLRAPPQPGVSDATRLEHVSSPRPVSLSPRASPRPGGGGGYGSPLRRQPEALPSTNMHGAVAQISLSGVPRPRRSLEPGAVRLSDTRIDGQHLKTMSSRDSLAGSLSADATWRSRTVAPGDCVKNAADMLPRRSRLTQMIVTGPQRSSAMARLVQSDASLASTQGVAPPPRSISSTSKQ